MLDVGGIHIVISCNVSFLLTVEDLEMNDGSAEKPYFMSKGMMKILGKNNKLEDPKSKSKEKEK